VNQRNPILFPVFSLFEIVRPKPELLIQQQVGYILIETGNSHIRGLVLRKSKGDHLTDKVGTHAPATGCGRNDDVSNGARAASVLPVKVRESHNRTAKLHDS